MNFKVEENRYRVWIFFGSRSTGILDALDDVCRGLVDALNTRNLKYQGLIWNGSLSISSIRKKKWKYGSMKLLSECTGYEQLAVYIFEDGLGKNIDLSKMLINIHLTSTNSLNSAIIRGAHVEVFGMIAISEEFEAHLASSSGLEKKIDQLMALSEPVAIRKWSDTPWIYDGLTGLNWAFVNLVAELKGGDLSTLRVDPVRL